MLTNEQISYMAMNCEIFETAYVTGDYDGLMALSESFSYNLIFKRRNVNEVYGAYQKLLNEGIEQMILKCDCKHSYQDEKHGKGQRVHNKANKASSPDQHAYRCTVCSHVQMVKVK